MKWPSLSVLIPSYNQGQYIERTILSILHQNYPGQLQVIVSDGGSKDSTVAVLEKYPEITWWSRRDRGFSDAVNQALAVATGKIIAIQSSDDFYLEGAFETALPVFNERPELGLVTGADAVVEQGVPLRMQPQPLKTKPLADPGSLLTNLGICQHCTFVRREAIDKVDGLKESADQCADFDLWYRILHFTQGIILPHYLGVYQMHPTQRTQSKAQLWIDSLNAVLENCRADEKYASAYTLPEATEWEFRKAMELIWYRAAGGEEGRPIFERVAREIIEGEQFSPYLRRRAGIMLRDSQVEQSPLLKLREKVQLRTRLREVSSQLLQPRKTVNSHTPIKVDVDWWERVPEARAR